MAATPLDLLHQPIINFKSFLIDGIELKEQSRALDRNQMLHIRVQETYHGYDVWGADGVLHIPHAKTAPKDIASLLSLASNQKGFANGVFYQHLANDLTNQPSYLASQEQIKRAKEIVLKEFERENGQYEISHVENKLMIYVDPDAHKAHWVYQVSFDAEPTKANTIPAKPHYLIDALTFKIYKVWDEVNTLTDVLGGGYGGNQKIGKIVYDGVQLAALNIQRDDETGQCYLQNEEVMVRRCTRSAALLGEARCAESDYFIQSCDAVDPKHHIYWNGEVDAINGAYSPSNDALYQGAVIKKMYQDWYGVPVLMQNGQPMLLKMIVHIPIDNAYWNGSSMNFGDGVTKFYPLVSLDVSAHEISHGFTTQHSNLKYDKYSQSGGINESFSDMAAKAAEYYVYRKNNWQIGYEVVKDEDKALRYMDWPSKDCKEDAKPGENCSINYAWQFHSKLELHKSSGVYNRLFYLLSTMRGWDTHKAFDVMVQANSYYWTQNATFDSAACGALLAAKDLRYSTLDVESALIKVGIGVTLRSCLA